jgi:hypothetical protein
MRRRNLVRRELGDSDWGRAFKEFVLRWFPNSGLWTQKLMCPSIQRAPRERFFPHLGTTPEMRAPNVFQTPISSPSASTPTAVYIRVAAVSKGRFGRVYFAGASEACRHRGSASSHPYRRQGNSSGRGAAFALTILTDFAV